MFDPATDTFPVVFIINVPGLISTRDKYFLVRKIDQRAFGGKNTQIVFPTGKVYDLFARLFVDDREVEVIPVILNKNAFDHSGKRSFGGMDMRQPAIDFVALAQSLGVKAVRVSDPKDIDGAMREATAAGEPRLVDFSVQDGFGGA